MESLLQFSLQDGSVSSDCSESVQYYTGGKMDSLLRVGFAGQLSTFHVHDTIKSVSTPPHRGTVLTNLLHCFFELFRLTDASATTT